MEVELDLNGQSITGTQHKSVGAVIKNNGKMSIRGGTISSTAANGGSAIQNNGELVIENAILNGASNADGSWPAYTLNNTGKMTISNSKITSVHGAVASHGEGAVVTMNNTDIDMSGIPGFTSHGIYTYSNGTVIVNGGNIENKATDQSSTGGSVINGAVTVNGGNFTGRLEDYYGTPVIKGGTFSVNPSPFIADGCSVEKDTTVGTWTVVQDYAFDADTNTYAVSTANGLETALAAASTADADKPVIITLTTDVAKEADTTAPYGNKYGLKMDGGVLDGNGNELEIECYGDDYGIMTSGGTIKNLTIQEGCRAIMIMYPQEDIILDNVQIGGDGVLYPINTGEAGAAGIHLIVTNSVLKGWTSYSNIESASFTNCEFGQGTYYNNIYGRVLKPYVNTTITNCSFIEHMNLDLSALTNGHKVTFKNSTVNGQTVTADVLTVPASDDDYDTELFTVDLPSWASSVSDCVIFDN